MTKTAGKARNGRRLKLPKCPGVNETGRLQKKHTIYNYSQWQNGTKVSLISFPPSEYTGVSYKPERHLSLLFHARLTNDCMTCSRNMSNWNSQAISCSLFLSLFYVFVVALHNLWKPQDVFHSTIDYSIPLAQWQKHANKRKKTELAKRKWSWRGKRPERRGAEWRGRSTSTSPLFRLLLPFTWLKMLSSHQFPRCLLWGRRERGRKRLILLSFFLPPYLMLSDRPAGYSRGKSENIYLPLIRRCKIIDGNLDGIFALLSFWAIRDCAQKRGEMPKWEYWNRKARLYHCHKGLDP